MKDRVVIVWVSLIVLVMIVGMGLPIAPALASMSSSTQVKPALVSLTGRINKLVVVGSCYQLTTENGQRYELLGKFPKRDGVKVKVTGVVVTDMVTICQVGQAFKVKSAQVLK